MKKDSDPSRFSLTRKESGDGRIAFGVRCYCDYDVDVLIEFGCMNRRQAKALVKALRARAVSVEVTFADDGSEELDHLREIMREPVPGDRDSHKGDRAHSPRD